jgi:hypothetical protein
MTVMVPTEGCHGVSARYRFISFCFRCWVTGLSRGAHRDNNTGLSDTHMGHSNFIGPDQ